LQHKVMIQLVDVLWKTVFFYVLLLGLLRVTGKREVGSLNAIDLVGFIMISEAAIISIADGAIPFVVGVTPVVLLGALEWIFAYLSMKDTRVRRLVEGEPSLVVSHGRINEKILRRLRFNLSDLMSELRFRNISNIADVEFAILETSGKMSVIPRAGARWVTPDDLKALGVSQADPASTLPHLALPATVVTDGEVDEDALRRAGKDRAWLDQELRNQGCPGGPAEVLVAVVDGQGQMTVQKRASPGAATHAEPDNTGVGPVGQNEAGATEAEGRRAAQDGRDGGTA